MITWTRIDLKNRAKETMHRNYWRMVLVGFIMLLATGGLSGGSSRGLTNIQNGIRQSTSTGAITESRRAGRELGAALHEIGKSAGTSTPAIAGGIAAVFFVVLIVVMVISAAFSFFLVQPLVIGGRRFFSRSLMEDAQLNEITFAFTNSYLNVVKNIFLMNLFIALWSLLFFIPGIVKSYEYRMIPYLLGEHPEMSTQELFQASREMMYGHKWSAFVLDLSFIGWNILGVITCGILYIFWVSPYIWLTNAALYHELSRINGNYGPQGGGYNQGNPYSQSGPYNQGNAYSQGNAYNQNDAYNQGNTYSQNGNGSQNTPYGQGYYTQNDSYGQENSGTQNSPYGQENGNGDAYNQGDPYQ